jgi:hypothetical protein
MLASVRPAIAMLLRRLRYGDDKVLHVNGAAGLGIGSGAGRQGRQQQLRHDARTTIPAAAWRIAGISKSAPGFIPRARAKNLSPICPESLAYSTICKNASAAAASKRSAAIYALGPTKCQCRIGCRFGFAQCHALRCRLASLSTGSVACRHSIQSRPSNRDCRYKPKPFGGGCVFHHSVGQSHGGIGDRHILSKTPGSSWPLPATSGAKGHAPTIKKYHPLLWRRSRRP